ncbi:MAG: PHA/PHB synthase family protein, partial [Janthinobacterium lividum]
MTIDQTDPRHLARWTDALTRGQAMMQAFVAAQAGKPLAAEDPLGLAATWTAVATAAATDPAKLMTAQLKFMTDSMALWTAFLTGKPADSPVAKVTDKRFAAAAWHEQPVFDFIRQSYLLASDFVMKATGDLDGLDPHAKAKALFHTRQIVDAMSPANFPLTNPEVLAATEASGGDNLLKGLEHMLDDMQRGRMRMTDETAFAVGRDVAATPGKVVFENRLFQLIQYAPATATVFATPLVIFPPWINKFYILDLTPEKSFIRWAVEQGLTVFVVSWKNADATTA